MNDEKIKSIFSFYAAASEACGDKKGETVEFCCPICQKKALAQKSKVNGHLHAKCEGCGTVIME